MDAPSIDDLRDALTEALRTYRQLRPQLFSTLLELQNTPGGPWKITYKRDPAEGDPTIPPKVQTQATVKAEMKIHDRPNIQFLNLQSVFNMPETFASFNDFTITKDETPVAPESAAAGIGLRIGLILDAMLKAAKTFAGCAHAVREGAREGRITSDARPILALDERFPFFPYWPRFTADKIIYDTEIAKEAPLLDAAEMAVALLTGKGNAPLPVPDTPLPAGNPFDNVEPHCHLPDDAKAALWAACKLVLANPGDFADALSWLDNGYSEVAIRERLLRESEWMHRSALRQLRRDGDRCNTFPRRMALRAARPKLPPERRLELLREFWSCPEIGGVREGFAKELIEHPETVREWVVRLTISTARARGLRIEDGKMVQRSYDEVGEKGLPDEKTVEIYWRWLDEQTRQSIRHYRVERRERDAQRREQAKDRAGRLRQAVADAMDTGLPAGREERAHARRVVLLACLLAYQHELTLPGEFGTWQWESTGSLFAALVGETYVPGRETVLFNPAHRPDEPFGPGSVNIDVERFAALVRRAVSVCGVNGNAPTSTQPPPTNGEPKLRSWTQPDLDNAIRQYKADRATSYADHCDAVKKNKAGARKKAKEIYGRNAIARALGVKSRAMVSKSPAWVAIAHDLGLPLNRNRRAQGTRHTEQPGKVGHEIAVEHKSSKPAEGADNAPAEQPLEMAERQETIRRINALASAGKSAKEKASNRKAADDLIQKLQRGECTDDQARQVVEMVLNPKG